MRLCPAKGLINIFRIKVVSGVSLLPDMGHPSIVQSALTFTFVTVIHSIFYQEIELDKTYFELVRSVQSMIF